MSEPIVMLVDNGSTRPAATLGLRAIAQRLAARCGRPVYPVSMQHANRVPADRLGGRPAEVLRSFLAAQLDRGQRDFVLLPLFFGRSRALTRFVPQQLDWLNERYGEFRLIQAAPLSPPADGEPRLAQILVDHIGHCATSIGGMPDRVILVDHGSPVPDVTAVREQLARLLPAWLPAGVAVEQAVMERRPGAEYDFNGPLLEQRLGDIRPAVDGGRTILAMLFLLPGRHAGPEGDIEGICRAAEARVPGLQVCISPLVGEHPALIDILKSRLDEALTG